MFLNRKKLFQGKYYDNSIKKHKQKDINLINSIILILNFIWFIINIYSQLKIKIVDFFTKMKILYLKTLILLL